MATEPWMTEPSAKAFESSGYLCEMLRNIATGTWAGYVTVSDGHPWYGLDAHASVTPLGDVYLTERTGPLDVMIELFSSEQRELGKLSLTLALDVHGGVTYAKGQPDAEWTFGFHCAHAGDFMPGLVRPGMTDRLFDGWPYRDIDYVTGQCARLAAQLRLVATRGTR